MIRFRVSVICFCLVIVGVSGSGARGRRPGVKYGVAGRRTGVNSSP